MGFWAEAEDPDPVVPNKAPAGPYDALFADAGSYYGQALNEANAWGPNAKATHVDPAYIARNDLAARGYQDANIARLQSIAGGGPGGVAVPTAYANLAAAGKVNNAVAASRANPGNAAMAMRTAQNTNQAMGAQNASKIAALGAQEQLAAYSALNNALGSARGQDQALGFEQAKLAQQAALANAGASQAAALANQDAYYKQYGIKRAALAGQFGNDLAATNARIADQRSLRNQQGWDRDIALQRQQRQDMATAAYLDTFSKGMQQFGKAGEEPPKYASDRRQKTEIREASPQDVEAAMYAAAFGGE